MALQQTGAGGDGGNNSAVSDVAERPCCACCVCCVCFDGDGVGEGIILFCPLVRLMPQVFGRHIHP